MQEAGAVPGVNFRSGLLDVVGHFALPKAAQTTQASSRNSGRSRVSDAAAMPAEPASPMPCS
jgi:hypothetical protein